MIKFGALFLHKVLVQLSSTWLPIAQVMVLPRVLSTAMSTQDEPSYKIVFLVP